MPSARSPQLCAAAGGEVAAGADGYEAACGRVSLPVPLVVAPAGDGAVGAQPAGMRVVMSVPSGDGFEGCPRARPSSPVGRWSSPQQVIVLSARSPQLCELSGGDGYEAAGGCVSLPGASCQPQQVMVLSVRNAQPCVLPGGDGFEGCPQARPSDPYSIVSAPAGDGAVGAQPAAMAVADTLAPPASGDGYEAARGRRPPACLLLLPQQVMVLSVRSPQPYERFRR